MYTTIQNTNETSTAENQLGWMRERSSEELSSFIESRHRAIGNDFELELL